MNEAKNQKLAQMVQQEHTAMIGVAATWQTLWRDLGVHVMPRKADNILTKQLEPTTAREDQLFDSTAVRANMVLANGMLSWMTPMESRWFSYDPPPELASNDRAKQWFRQCSEIAQAELASSNFYSEIHEFYLDNGAFGTSLILCEQGKRTLLHFTKVDVGTFYIREDDEGYVDGVIREFEFTVLQARDKWGYEGLSDKMKKLLDGNSTTKATQTYKFVHMICVRKDDDREWGRMDGENKPVASIYCEVDSGYHVCSVGGYDEFPAFVSRFLKWNASPYGWCPAWAVLPDARQLNFLQMQMDALAELSAFPRFLAPDNIDEIDYRASGVTYYDSARPEAIPKEWGTVGSYDIGVDRVERKQKAIDMAFYVDLFQMFAQLDKQMTAREVAERASEKLIQFSPSFARKTTEVFNPLLKRVFALLARNGKFPAPPPDVHVFDETGAGFLPEPQVAYSSRIALAIKALETTSFLRTTEMLLPLIQVRPDILDNYDMDQIARDISRNNGEPARWLLDEERVAQVRAERAAAQKAAQEAQTAEMMAGAAAKAGSVKPDSVLGQALTGG